MQLRDFALVSVLVSFLLLAGCTGFPSAGGPTAGPVCGDKVLQGAEQCELGINCTQPGYICSDCMCVPKGAQGKNISCASNGRLVANGLQNTFVRGVDMCKDDCRLNDPQSVCDPQTCTCGASCANNSFNAIAAGVNISNMSDSNLTARGLVCKDDCKAINPNLICDAKKCACVIPPGPMTMSCSGNSLFAAWTGVNMFDPKKMVCKDDCAAVDPNTKCDATCICVPKKPTVNCAANTNNMAAGKPNAFNPANNICKDDCKAADPLTTCDAKTCTCKKRADYSCIGNTISTALGAKNDFNPLGGIACKDDCKSFDQDLVCNAQTCICDYPPGEPQDTLPCATNTLFESDTKGGSIYDPAKYRCEDNCRELDENLVCDMKSCLCIKPTTEGGLSCANNTRPTTGKTLEKAPPGVQCRDDCLSSFGSAYECNPVACQCVKKDIPREVSCAGNSPNTAGTSFFDVYTDIAFKPGYNICKDDCQSLGSGYECDAVSCVCTKQNESGSCQRRSYEAADGGKIPAIAAGVQCKDDCKQIEEGLVCEPQACVCKPPSITEGTSCGRNTYDDVYGQNSYKGGFCKDDCKETVGSDYSCDPVTCTCLAPEQQISCSQNSLMSVFLSSTAPIGAGLMCKDDCKQLGEGFACDSKLCVCRPLPITEGTSCSRNSFGTYYGEANNYTGGYCKDDCKIIGDRYKCDAASCICKEESPPEPIKCSAKQAAAGQTVERLAEGLQCQDDCQSLGSGYKCDAISCTCIKTPTTIDRSCAANSVYKESTGVAIPADAGVTAVCKDDCKTLSPDLQCDVQSCTCRPTTTPGGPISCAMNRLAGDKNPTKYDPRTMQCKDDCEKLWAPGSKCDPETCICQDPPITQTETSCAGNSFVTQLTTGQKNTFNYTTMLCRDNCKQLDESLICDTKACMCVPPQAPPAQLDCASNSLASTSMFGGKNAFDPKFTRCQDNCQELEEYAQTDLVCDSQTCTCKRSEAVDCYANSFLYGLTGGYLGNKDAQNAYKLGMQCKDNCKQYNIDSYCDQNTCVCRLPEKETVSCASRIGTTLEKLPQGAVCKDDCPQGSICDPVSCSCGYTVTPLTISCAAGQPGTTAELPLGAQCKDDCSSLGQGYTCDAASCTCKPPQTAGVCGDGKILSPEQCDLGSYETNKCPQGTYCTKDCQCKKIETSVVCGDGKISSPGEDCDGGNVATNICPQGYSCRICKCVQTSTVSQCGDGTVYPPEECDHGNTYTAQCPNGLTCINCRCKEPTGAPVTHTECDTVHQVCMVVNGTGTDECTNDEDCAPAQVCGNGVREGTEQCDGSDKSRCSQGQTCTTRCTCTTPAPTQTCGNNQQEGTEQCDGTDMGQCSQGQQCVQCSCYTPPPQYHYECDFTHGACMKVEGAGSSNCAKDSDCQPPVVDCPVYCRGQGYDTSLGGGYSSAAACKEAASEAAVQCTTTCIYTTFYSKSNQAGTATCCCKAKYVYQCTDCPGQRPVCPQCPATKPS